MRASILALGPLRRALRRGARVAAGRLRDRPAPGRPARQGPGGDGRRDRPRARLHQRAREAAHRRALRVRRRHRDRHREPDDGGDARRGHDRRSRTPRASRRSSTSRAASSRWARASTARAPTASSIEGVDAPARRDARDHARPHRDRDVPRGGRRGGRRRRRSTGTQADTLDAVLDKLREAGAAIDGARPTRSASRGAGRSRAFTLRTAPYPGLPDRHAGADDGARRARRRHVGRSPRRSSRTG